MSSFIHFNIVFWVWVIGIIFCFSLNIAYVFFSVILLYKHRSLRVIYGVGSVLGVIYGICLLKMWVCPNYQHTNFGEDVMSAGAIMLIFWVADLFLWCMCSFADTTIAGSWEKWFKKRLERKYLPIGREK